MLANNENRMYKIIVNGIAFIPIKLTIKITDSNKQIPYFVRVKIITFKF